VTSSPELRPTVHALFAAALRWGMLHSSHVDDVMLALVSPQTYHFLRAWQQHTFGDQGVRARALNAARGQLTSMLQPDFARQIETVSVRSKGLWSTFHKAVVRRDPVYDVMALRVVVRGDAHDCMRVLDAVHRLWPALPGRCKNYIFTPKKNGYQALHDTVVLPGGQHMEIQIRTDEMHARAEYGPASHRRYKGALFAMPRTMLTGFAAPVALHQRRSFYPLLRWVH